MPSHPSPSPLPDDARDQSAALVNEVAIDLLGLAAVARKAHWNVRGPLFAPLHELFGKLYEKAGEHADTLAEHAAMLGAVVAGDHVEIAQRAGADPLPAESDGARLLAAVLVEIRQFLADLMPIKRELARLRDDEGQQLVLDASIAVAKIGWMLQAHAAPNTSAESTADAG